MIPVIDMTDQPVTARAISLPKERTGLVWTTVNARTVEHPVLLALAFAAAFPGMLVYNGRHTMECSHT